MATWRYNEPGVTYNSFGLTYNGWGTFFKNYYTGAIHLGKQLLMRGIGF